MSYPHYSSHANVRVYSGICWCLGRIPMMPYKTLCLDGQMQPTFNKCELGVYGAQDSKKETRFDANPLPQIVNTPDMLEYTT